MSQDVSIRNGGVMRRNLSAKEVLTMKKEGWFGKTRGINRTVVPDGDYTVTFIDLQKGQGIHTLKWEDRDIHLVQFDAVLITNSGPATVQIGGFTSEDVDKALLKRLSGSQVKVRCANGNFSMLNEVVAVAAESGTTVDEDEE